MPWCRSHVGPYRSHERLAGFGIESLEAGGCHPGGVDVRSEAIAHSNT